MADESTSPPSADRKMSKLPAVGTKLLVEINHATVDAIVQSYLKGKKRLEDASIGEADSVLLKLLGLPVGDRTIDTETTISIKYLREIVRDNKKSRVDDKDDSKELSEGQVSQYRMELARLDLLREVSPQL